MEERIKSVASPPLHDGLKLLKSLQGLEVYDVLNFRETWTDRDMELLRSDGHFEFSKSASATFVAQLPIYKVFQAFVERSSKIAIVGASQCLTGADFGPQIDNSPEVTRFNQHVGAQLNAADTGYKTTIHVLNQGVPLGLVGGSDILTFDLEWANIWLAYCNHGGKANKVFIFRPTAVCSKGQGLGAFTRGFLFYWFVGRLFQEVEMYGFGGVGKYDETSTVGYDPIIHFEHLVYRVVQNMTENCGNSTLRMFCGNA